MELNLVSSVTQDELDLLFLHPEIFLYLLRPYSFLLTVRPSFWLSHMGLMKVIHTVSAVQYTHTHTHIYIHSHYESLVRLWEVKKSLKKCKWKQIKTWKKKTLYQICSIALLKNKHLVMKIIKLIIKLLLNAQWNKINPHHHSISFCKKRAIFQINLKGPFSASMF